MAGATLESELTATRVARAPFALAGPADDAEIRRLLRENPMQGRIAITLEREPDYFADVNIPGTAKQTVIARNGGSVICVGSCAVRERFVNGEPRRVGYLGGLRLDSKATRRFEILRGGYEFFRKVQLDEPADFYFTSIASDNASARRFLERGLPRMPTYEIIGEFVTVLLPVRKMSAIHASKKAEAPDPGELVEFLNQRGRTHQFSARWSADELYALSALGLRSDDFHVEREKGRIVAVAAYWDQRCFKQTVIHGYAPWLAMSRPAVNFASRVLGMPRLPAVGSTLAHAYVSPFVVEPGYVDASFTLIESLGAMAAGRGVEFLTVGFAAKDPSLAMLRSRFRFREYSSRIYVVRWPGLGGSALDLDGRCLGPEVALL